MSKNYITSLSQTHGKTIYLTILYATKNTMMYLDDIPYPMAKNDMILCRENITWHADVPVYTIRCKKEAFDELFFTQIADCKILYDFLKTKITTDEYLYFGTSKETTALKMMALLQEEIKKTDTYHDKMLNLLITGLFTSLDRSRKNTLQLANSTMVSDNVFGRILNYIGNHYATCSLKETAEVLGYHPDYLSAYFRKITGVTFKEKLLSIRLEKAEELLLTTDYTVEQIAYKVGFQDKSWFQKKFKETYNQTPAKYRKEHQ